MTRFSNCIVAFTAVALAVPGMAQVAPPAPPAPPPVVAEKSPDAMTSEEFAAWKKKNGSWYVQCDGLPDNMSAGETAARLIALSAVIGLLAPPPESADPAKRKFGEAGVAACTRLIEGEKRESRRRAAAGTDPRRGAHRIQAKDYAGAIADAALARKDAADAGLAADPYWVASRGRGADLLEAAAYYRLGKVAEASAAELRGLASARYAAFSLLGMPSYFAFSPAEAAGERDYADAVNHAYPWLAKMSADRLEQLGKFADAATLRDALVDLNAGYVPKSISSLRLAQAAVTHALAGHTERAAELAKQAQANFDRRKTEGKPDPDPAEVVEQLDLYNIIRVAGVGDLKTARRLFSARSQWVSASFGATVEVNRRLRVGAPADDLIGGLEKTPAQLWKARADDDLARVLATDADNKTLFAMFPATAKSGDYESAAKNAWKTAKSPWIVKPKKDEPNPTGYEIMFNYGAAPGVMAEAYMMHAALLAKSRGHQGFVIMPIVLQNLFAAQFKTGNPGDPGLPAPLFNNADTVIAALSPVLPDPDTLKARQAARAH